MAGFCYPHPSFCLSGVTLRPQGKCQNGLKNSKIKVSANYFRVNKPKKEDPQVR